MKVAGCGIDLQAIAEISRETIPQPAKNIAEAVRHSIGPTGDMADLSAQATRLHRSVRVAEQWIEATMKANAPTEMIHDQREEELSGPATSSWARS